MAKKRLVILLLLLLSSGVSTLLGYVHGRSMPAGLIDLTTIYYGTECLLHHCDPYNQNDLWGVFQRDTGVVRQSGPGRALQLQAVTLYINMPATSIFMAPLAFMPWSFAYRTWTFITVGFLTLAAFLMWDLSSVYDADISFYMICFVLGNCIVLFTGGNPAGLAIGLCLVAVWCFLRNRFATFGVVCLAASLAIKPHDAGFIWLFFLLAGGLQRKRALQTLAWTLALSLLAALWVTHVAPHWLSEMHSNLLTGSAPGNINDPGPDSITARTPGMIIDLQTVVSVFWGNPLVYNTVSYVVCGMLLLPWTIKTLRTHASQATTMLALAPIASLTMLVTYHRTHDAKLLLLTVPACAMLWSQRRHRWLALLLTGAGIVCTGDYPLVFFTDFTNRLNISATGPLEKLLTIVLLRPLPLILLAETIFYLWVYLGYDSRGDVMNVGHSFDEEALALRIARVAGGA